MGVSLPAPVDHFAGRVVGPSVMRGWDDFELCGFREQRASCSRARRQRRQSNGAGGIPSVLAAGSPFPVHKGWNRDRQRHHPQRGALLRRARRLGGHRPYPIRGGERASMPMRKVRLRGSARRRVGDRARPQGKWHRCPQRARCDRPSQQREPDAIRRVREAGRVLGEVAADVVSVLNPTTIVVGGTLSRAGDHLLAGVKEMIYRRSLPLALDGLGIFRARSRRSCRRARGRPSHH